MSQLNVIEFPRPERGGKSPELAERPQDVFSVGEDEEILERREREIRSRTGMRVRSVRPVQAESWARSTARHVWVFCTTVEFSRMVYLACSVRRYSPGSRLLLLKERVAPGFEKTLFDEVLRTPASPEAVVSAVRRLAAG